MNIKTVSKLLGCCSILLSSAAFAQNTVTADSVTASIGSTGNTFTVDYVDGGAGVQGFQFDVNIANADITVTNIVCSPIVFGACPVASNNFTVVTLDAGGGNIPDTADVITVTYDVAGGATPAIAPIDLLNEVNTGVVDGQIEIVAGPSLVAMPNTLSLNAVVNGTDSDTFDLSAQNGTITGLACNGTGDTEISFAGTVPATLADTDPAVTITATCGAPAAAMFNASFDCTFDGGGALSVPVDCTVANGTAAPMVDPVSGSTIIFGPLAPGASSIQTVTFSEVNNQGVGYDVTNCVLGTGTDFSLSAAMVTVPAGGSNTIDITGTAPVDGSTSMDTLTCDVDGAAGAFTANLEIAPQPQIVPTLSQWAMILMALLLAGFGVVVMRRRVEG